jgi:hypothetical protein
MHKGAFLRIGAASFFDSPAIVKGNGVGIYGIVDHVTFETNTYTPDSILISKVFIARSDNDAGFDTIAPELRAASQY